MDWRQIGRLYARLLEQTRSPVVALNHTVAIARADEPQRELAILDTLKLEQYPNLHSTPGELLARLGHTDEARAAFHRALTLARQSPTAASSAEISVSCRPVL